MRNVVFFTACAVLALVSVTAAADQVIWNSGANQYVKIVDQDHFSDGPTPPNQQPVTLQPEQIRDALDTIQTWEKSFLHGQQARQVFSTGQADILGTYLSQALARARPDQDIVFALVRRNKHFMGIESITYMAGRAFYANDRLNVIIGDYDRPPDKLKEEAYGSAGLTEVPYYFTSGRRARASGFKKSIMATDGVSVHQGRPDWLIVDVKTAAATYAAEVQKAEHPNSGAPVNDAAVKAEAARLEQERLELRLEMARMKKEMSQANTHGESIEARLKELKELRDKKLITEAEYQARRKQILDEI